MTAGNWRLWLLLLTSALFFGCDDAPKGNTADTSCPEGKVFDDLYGDCVFVVADTTDADELEVSEPDVLDEEVAEEVVEDTAPEVVEVLDTDNDCDKDMDGAWSLECGGNDCDDNNFNRAPDRREFCDDIDNNCDGNLNEGLNCTFYANTGQLLYQIDPIKKVVSAPLPIVRDPNETGDMQWLTDIDTSPDGILYGVAKDYPDAGTVLYQFDDWLHVWSTIGSSPNVLEPSGLAISTDGVAYVLAGDSMYTMNLATGQANLVGPLGSGFFASGDCVMNKNDSLYMTSKAAGQNDTLVLVETTSGQGTALGDVGFANLYGLTVAWGKMYGLNSAGQVIEINPITGAGTLVTTFSNISWWGAASTPNR